MLYKRTKKNPIFILIVPIFTTLFMSKLNIPNVSNITTILCMIDIGINIFDNLSRFMNLLMLYTTTIEITVIKLLMFPNDNSVETIKNVIIVINVDKTPNELNPLSNVLILFHVSNQILL